MSGLVAIPLSNGLSVVTVTGVGLQEVASIPFDEQPKSVVCENETIVSLVKYGSDCYVHAHKIEHGKPILVWEKLISNEVRYSHIAVKGNVVYLAALYLPKVPFEPLITLDFTSEDVVIKAVEKHKEVSDSNILNFKIVDNTLYVFENRYPMGVIEYDVSNPSDPKFLGMRELQVSTKMQFVKNFAVSREWMAVIANYNDNLNLANYLHIYGHKTISLKSYFDKIYQYDPKYIEQRQEMGLLPEDVALESNYALKYSLRKVLTKPFVKVIPQIFRRQILKQSRFNLKLLSYQPETVVDIRQPIRIVETMFSGDTLFVIANGRVGYIDTKKLGHNSTVDFIPTSVKSPLKFINIGLKDALIVRSDSDYELVRI